MRTLEQRIEEPMTREEAWREFATLNPVLADGHFFVGFADWRADTAAHLGAGGLLFPFEVYVTEDAEVFIRAQLGGTETPFAGMRIESINGVDARVVSTELLARTHGDTQAFRLELLSRRWWFYYWKMYGAKPAFDLVLAREKTTSVRLPGSSVKPAILVDEASFERQFHLEFLADHSALLTVSTFGWPDKKQFFNFTRDAFSTMREAGTQTLIIDIRTNGGGDDDMWIEGILPYIATKPYRWASSYRKRIMEPYRDEGETIGDVVSGPIDRWIPPEDNSLRYSGKTYVLIGRATYSSAVLFTNVMRDFSFGIIAGTGGSARADQSGGVQKIVLPNTGLAVWAPRFILTRPSAASEPVLVQPDIPIQENPLRPGAAVEELLLRASAARESQLRSSN